MTAGWGVRTTRAAVFAAVCVLLAALGHVLMSGSAVPWWTLSAGFAVTGGAGWVLAGRERGLAPVVSVVVVAQGALHSAFSWGGASAPDSGTGLPAHQDPGAMSGMSGMSMGSMHMGPMHMGPMHMGSLHMDAMDMGSPGPLESLSLGHLAHTGQLGHHMAHGADGVPSGGMLAAHTLAALLTGLWLAHGERAAFRLLRAVAGWLAAPLRLPLLALPVPPHRPRPRPADERAERVPRLTLTHTIISRGPPAGTAVV
ncbi:hypothetical protein JHN52_10620 [Streptomyces sp. MBT97]|uniref:hypothetical protein n=1 Tax=Streptomyces sp. MBT97 TaxID=2800411 RepID=UPI00190916C9|nr:hypothetical protein [Streptomyces sp. MBT97]MBK3633394.1 hypothetical protein [Streptomyces sp. MBT97]